MTGRVALPLFSWFFTLVTGPSRSLILKRIDTRVYEPQIRSGWRWWWQDYLERQISGYLKTGIRTPMAQGWPTKIISMIKWIRTSRLSIKNSLSLWQDYGPGQTALKVASAAAMGFTNHGALSLSLARALSLACALSLSLSLFCVCAHSLLAQPPILGP